MKKIMFDEVWKDIAEFDGYYQVSNYGRVRRSDNHRIKASPLNAYGYPQVNLYKNGKAHLRRVHRLVAMAFIPNPNNLPMINHKDEVPIMLITWNGAMQSTMSIMAAGTRNAHCRIVSQCFSIH